jgi:hypothetical protein
MTIVGCRILHASLSYSHSPSSRMPRVGWWQNCRDIIIKPMCNVTSFLSYQTVVFYRISPIVFSRDFVVWVPVVSPIISDMSLGFCNP